jgi:DNA-binding SARP family transcriptional activator
MQDTQDLEFAVLGPLAVRRGGRQVPACGLREQAVLAMLLLADGGMVTVDRLVEAVWDDDPPVRAGKAIRNCVSAWRRRLAEAGAPAPIDTTAAGYRLRLEDCRLDARQFRQQSDAAGLLAAGGQAAQAAAGLRAALSLWRGPALAGIEARIVQAGTARLDEQRMTVLEDCLDLELALGRHRQAVSELQALAREYPLRERITAQLMLALYRSGRQGEALGTYRQLASRLARELGIDPAREVTWLHQAILRQDPSLDLGHATRLQGPRPGCPPRPAPCSPPSAPGSSRPDPGAWCERDHRKLDRHPPQVPVQEADHQRTAPAAGP